MGESVPQRTQTFAEKLTRLIETVHPEGRRQYSYREIEAGIRRMLGDDHPGVMTAAYVQQLATGRQVNPRLHYIQALAKFFGVPPSYFTDDQVSKTIIAELDRVVAWRRSADGELAQRISALLPEHRNTVAAIVEHLSDYDQQPRSSRRRRTSASPNTDVRDDA